MSRMETKYLEHVLMEHKKSRMSTKRVEWARNVTNENQIRLEGGRNVSTEDDKSRWRTKRTEWWQNVSERKKNILKSKESFRELTTYFGRRSKNDETFWNVKNLVIKWFRNKLFRKVMNSLEKCEQWGQSVSNEDEASRLISIED